jgi:acetyl-CoA carboxylase biotin carboxyl carrier protein
VVRISVKIRQGLLSYCIVTVEEIRELINLAAETGIAELEVQRGENRVRIRRAAFPGATQEILLAPSAAAAAPAAAPPAAAPVTAPPSHEAPKEKPADPNLTLVKSPIVGTFYESPSPGAPAFVQPGERVQPGKVLCIIESMKLMNEIEAETAGIVESRLVMNGQPVEYGEALFAIRAV